MKLKANRENALIERGKTYQVNLMQGKDGNIFYRVKTGIDKCPHQDMNYHTLIYYFGEDYDPRFEYGNY